jgi:hypothetical protein
MKRVTPLSLLVLLVAGCTMPVTRTGPDEAALARAEAARARYRALQDAQKPRSASEFVPVHLRRGPHIEGGIARTGAETVILVPVSP